MAEVKWSTIASITAALTDEIMLLDDPEGTPANGVDRIQDILDLLTGDISVASGVATLDANTVDSAELVNGSIDEAHLSDNAVTLAKMAGGTDGNIITFDASGDPAVVATGSSTQVLTSNGAGTAPTFQAAAGGARDYDGIVPCVLEVPQGTVAFPDIRSMTGTENKKITGIVLPDGGSASTINFKLVIPPNLASTPAMSIRIRFITLTADTAHAVRLILKTVGLAVNEDFDVDFTDETEVTAECPDANDTGNEALINIDLSTDWTAGDTVMGLITRDPTDTLDDYAGDIMIVGVEMLVKLKTD